MAHMIESLFLNREPAWHGLGTIVADAPTSEEAIRLAGLDWNVNPMPVQAIINGNPEDVPGYVANVRESDNSILGIVTKKYKIVQNVEAFQFTDNLVGEGATYESAGSLINGKVWMLAKLPESSILGDTVVPYLVFSNSFDGKGAINVSITPTRVVCQNTLNLALKNAVRSWTTRHMGDMESKKWEAAHCLELSTQYMDSLATEAEILANKQVTNSEFDQFVESLFPIDELDSVRKQTNIISLRDELSNRYYNAPDIKMFRGTAWGFMQAVTDMVDHTSPKRNTPTYKENLFIKIADGHSLVDDAYKLVA